MNFQKMYLPEVCDLNCWLLFASCPRFDEIPINFRFGLMLTSYDPISGAVGESTGWANTAELHAQVPAQRHEDTAERDTREPAADEVVVDVEPRQRHRPGPWLPGVVQHFQLVHPEPEELLVRCLEQRRQRHQRRPWRGDQSETIRHLQKGKFKDYRKSTSKGSTVY